MWATQCHKPTMTGDGWNSALVLGLLLGLPHYHKPKPLYIRIMSDQHKGIYRKRGPRSVGVIMTLTDKY